MNWYSMTAIYLWRESGDFARKYETRTTICQAPDDGTAEEKLLKEGKEYCTGGFEFLGKYNIQRISETPGAAPVEVASSMVMGIDPTTGDVIDEEEFIRTRWNDRIEDCETLGLAHSWHNKDGERSACHNCRIVREGQLWRVPEPADVDEKIEKGGEAEA